MYRRIDKCRICENKNLVKVLDLGDQMLTGVFPVRIGEEITSGPLSLVKCVGDDHVCGLLQLEYFYDLEEMYGDNYGYRSGLNPSMVAHLQAKVRNILCHVDMRADDLVIDIGSNDGTTLRAYPPGCGILIGIDPTGSKFATFYPDHVELIADFFSADLVKKRFGDRKAKVITSFSMFYDLEDPMGFMHQIHDILADDGIWVFEQSYMPRMLEINSYDTICHEHLEFYALRQIRWMADRVGFCIRDVEFNDVNGGSFSVTVTKARSGTDHSPLVEQILGDERSLGLDTLVPFRMFAERVQKARENLRQFVQKARSEGKTVVGLGASTKGNVLLQYCQLSADDLVCIGEINPDKYGRFTPGTWIPIVSEDEMLAKEPDYLLVLPWHFRSFFVSSPKFAQRNLVFPLPVIELLGPERLSGTV